MGLGNALGGLVMYAHAKHSDTAMPEQERAQSRKIATSLLNQTSVPYRILSPVSFLGNVIQYSTSAPDWSIRLSRIFEMVLRCVDRFDVRDRRRARRVFLLSRCSKRGII